MSLENPRPFTIEAGTKRSENKLFDYNSWPAIKSMLIVISIPDVIYFDNSKNKPHKVKLLAGNVICSYSIKQKYYLIDNCIIADDPHDLKPGTFVEYPYDLVVISANESVEILLPPSRRSHVHVQTTFYIKQDWSGRPLTRHEEHPAQNAKPVETK